MKKHLDSESPGSPDGIDAYVHYFYNRGWQVFQTRRSASENTGPESLQPEYQYVWSLRYIDAPVLRDENTDADSLCDDDRKYYLDDANFNVTTLVDTAGDAVERYVYSPYGVLTVYDATWANIRSDSSYAVAYTYTGRRLDPETGLYYYRHRTYHSQLGRFVSRDPVGYRGGVGLSGFLSGCPVADTDPTGLASYFFRPWPWWKLDWVLAEFDPIVNANGQPIGHIKGLTIPDPKETYIECKCKSCWDPTNHDLPESDEDAKSNECGGHLECIVHLVVKYTMINSDTSVVPEGMRKWVYGHEQRHVGNMLRITMEITDELTKEENELGCVDPAICSLKKDEIIGEYSTEMAKRLKEDSQHRRYPDPQDDHGYPPFNNYFPREPKDNIGKVPLTSKSNVR